jgi:hypothetical protein
MSLLFSSWLMSLHQQFAISGETESFGSNNLMGQWLKAIGGYTVEQIGMNVLMIAFTNHSFLRLCMKLIGILCRLLPTGPDRIRHWYVIPSLAADIAYQISGITFPHFFPIYTLSSCFDMTTCPSFYTRLRHMDRPHTQTMACARLFLHRTHCVIHHYLVQQPTSGNILCLLYVYLFGSSKDKY